MIPGRGTITGLTGKKPNRKFGRKLIPSSNFDRQRFRSRNNSNNQLIPLQERCQFRRLSTPKEFTNEDSNQNVNTTSISMSHNQNDMDFDEEMITEIPPMRSQSYQVSLSQSVDVQIQSIAHASESVQEIMQGVNIWPWIDGEDDDDRDSFLSYHEALCMSPIYERSPGKKVLIMPMYDAHKQALSDKNWVHVVNGKCQSDKCNRDSKCHHALINDLIKKNNPTKLFFVVKFAFPSIFAIRMQEKSENFQSCGFKVDRNDKNEVWS